jgi:hypothetical protein
MRGKLPEALALGINRTARGVEQRLQNEMESKIDRPTPFTLNAVKIWDARPREPVNAIVALQPIQARYLRYAIFGGTLPTVIEPVNARLDNHGNIVGKRSGRGGSGLRGIASKGRRRFVAEINGTLGVWERTGRQGRGLKLIVAVHRRAERDKRWDFSAIAKAEAQRRMARDINDALRQVLR